jgi:ABC-type bacteriocin/lantibiotic exporter with double-glycine peptidase domain
MFNFDKIKKIIDREKFYILKKIFFSNFLYSFVEFFSILSLPIFVSLLIDKNYLVEKYNFKIFFGSYENDLIIIISVLIVLIFLIKNIFYIFLIYIQSKFIEELKILVSEKVFNGYILGSYYNHLNKSPSLLTRDTTYSVQSFGFYIFHLINLFRELISITLLVLLVFFIKPLIIIIAGIFFSLIVLSFHKKLKKVLNIKASENEKLNSLFIKDVFNTFLSIKDIKILKKESEIIEKFKTKVKKFEKNLFFFQVLEKIPKLTLELLSIIFLLIICLVLFRVSEDQTEFFTTLSVFLVAIVRLLPGFTSLISSLNYLKIFKPGLINLYNQSEKLNSPSKNYQSDFKGFYVRKKNIKLVVVEDLSFGYFKKKNLLQNINFEIIEGKMNCITGETGSGKTTLFNLMLGLLEPRSGNIYYRGKNIKSDISNWHKAISLVSQEPYLFDDTIINNITFNALENNIDNKRLVKAIEISELSETIKKLEKGLHTKVSSQSINLSGGEKQRIALARALYKDSDILFLDEFTNAIDEEKEKKILSNLKKLVKKTFIIISHKKSTIGQCNKIWKLKNGKIN